MSDSEKKFGLVSIGIKPLAVLNVGGRPWAATCVVCGMTAFRGHNPAPGSYVCQTGNCRASQDVHTGECWIPRNLIARAVANKLRGVHGQYPVW